MDAPQSVIGLRQWTVLKDTKGKRPFVLKSYARDYVWQGVVHTADRAPSTTCAHGLWAVWPHERDSMHETSLISGTNGPLLGTVEAFGKVVPGKLGFRAERVMITGFESPKCTCGADATLTLFDVTQAREWTCDACAPAHVTPTAPQIATPVVWDAAAHGWQVFTGVKFGSRCQKHGCRYKVYLYKQFSGYRLGYCAAHKDNAQTYGVRQSARDRNRNNWTAVPAADVLRALRERYDIPRPMDLDAEYGTAPAA